MKDQTELDRLSNEHTETQKHLKNVLEQTHQKKETKLLKHMLELLELQYEYHEVLFSLLLFLSFFFFFAFSFSTFFTAVSPLPLPLPLPSSPSPFPPLFPFPFPFPPSLIRVKKSCLLFSYFFID